MTGITSRRKPLLDRFMEKTEHDPVAGCRIWQGATSSGYGSIRVAGKLRAATHVAIELATGQSVPAGNWVRPTCGVATCVAFDHLRVEAAYGSGVLRKKRLPLERLFEKTVRELKTGCRIYIGALDTYGYGLFYLDGRLMGAHRASFILDSGAPIPEGMVVRHRCDQTCCVEPSHLQLGTSAENSQDRTARGRSERGDTLLPELRSPDRAAMLAAQEAGFSFQEIIDGWALSPSGTTQALSRARRERTAAASVEAA